MHLQGQWFVSRQCFDGCITLITLLAIMTHSRHVGGGPVRHERSDTQTDGFPCGRLEYCVGVGYSVCVQVDGDSSCYPCTAFENKCGTRDQRPGCHLHCHDILRHNMTGECNNTLAGMSDTSDEPVRTYFIPFLVSTVICAVLVLILVIIGCKPLMHKWWSSVNSLSREANTDGNQTPSSDRREPLGGSTNTGLTESTVDQRSQTTTNPDDSSTRINVEPDTEPLLHRDPRPGYPISSTGQRTGSNAVQADPETSRLQLETRESQSSDGCQQVQRPERSEEPRHYCEDKLKNVNPAQKDFGEMAVS